MYENLPFWFDILHQAELRGGALAGVQPSALSSRASAPSPPTRSAIPPSWSTAMCAGAAGGRVWTPSCYPCMTYNIDEGIGDNHYNCPVVAYYPDLIAANIPALEETKHFDPRVLWACAGTRTLPSAPSVCCPRRNFGIPKKETVAAVESRLCRPTPTTWPTSARPVRSTSS